MFFAKMGNKKRADFIRVLPKTNVAYTWYNECSGGGGPGADDGPITDPQLPDLPTDPSPIHPLVQ